MHRNDECATIILAGESRAVRAPTLDQIQDMLPALEGLSGGTTADRLKSARRVVSIALEMEDAELGKLRASVAELVAAVPVILKLAGLQPGEAHAPGQGPG